VLIIHTHGTEAYCEDGAISIKETGELARSEDPEKNVVAVGRAFKAALKKQGINSIHCEILHDADGYRDAYSRAEETIKQYLDRYPTIQLVVDIHRDAIIKSNGEIVRPVTAVDGKAVAQVMCVVGSDWGGQANGKWEVNLSLALKLRESLNSKGEGICRPTYLKSSTYNQEIAPYSLLLEVGACGNSLEEAEAAAELSAIALAQIILKK
jgi:stage II sporulation protein P